MVDKEVLSVLILERGDLRGQGPPSGFCPQENPHKGWVPARSEGSVTIPGKPASSDCGAGRGARVRAGSHGMVCTAMCSVAPAWAFPDRSVTWTQPLRGHLLGRAPQQ